MSALHPLKRLNRSPHHAAGRSAAIAFLLWLSVGTYEIKLTEAGAKDTVGPVPATINARDLGARGDGRTDDAPAIQQAINRVSATGGRVLLPPSERPYLIGSSLVIAADNVELDAIGATVQLTDGASSGKEVHCLVVGGTEVKPICGVVVRGLTVDANYWNQQEAKRPRGIECNWATNVLFENVTVRRAWVSLAFSQGSSHSEARDCTVSQWHNDGFDASGDGVTGATHHIKFVRCRAVDSPNQSNGGLPGSRDDAWEIEDGAVDIELIDCVVENAGGKSFGIRNHPPSGRHTRNITFVRFRSTNAGPGYAMSLSQDNSVDGIRLVDCQSDAGLSFRGPIRDVEITGGKFIGPVSFSAADPGAPRPPRNVTISGAEFAELSVNLQPGNDGQSGYQPTLVMTQTKVFKRFVVVGDKQHLSVKNCQLPR
jgi:hypothetical protein